MDFGDDNSLLRAGNYFNIEDILATNEKVPCIINVNIPTVGKLNTSKSSSADLVANTEAEMPLWLVKSLVEHKLVTPILPTMFNAKYRLIYKADPGDHDIRSWSPYFYQIMWHYLNMKSDESEKISLAVSRLLQERTDNIMRNAICGDEDIYIKTKLKLDELEKSIFNQVINTRIQNKMWFSGKIRKIEPPLLRRLKRRRPNDE